MGHSLYVESKVRVSILSIFAHCNFIPFVSAKAHFYAIAFYSKFPFYSLKYSVFHILVFNVHILFRYISCFFLQTEMRQYHQIG
jgi:hypothetical protein